MSEHVHRWSADLFPACFSCGMLKTPANEQRDCKPPYAELASRSPEPVEPTTETINEHWGTARLWREGLTYRGDGEAYGLAFELQPVRLTRTAARSFLRGVGDGIAFVVEHSTPVALAAMQSKIATPDAEINPAPRSGEKRAGVVLSFPGTDEP